MPVSRATFSFTHHSTTGPLELGELLDDLGRGRARVAAGEAQPGAHGAAGDRFVTRQEGNPFHDDPIIAAECRHGPARRPPAACASRPRPPPAARSRRIAAPGAKRTMQRAAHPIASPRRVASGEAPRRADAPRQSSREAVSGPSSSPFSCCRPRRCASAPGRPLSAAGRARPRRLVGLRGPRPRPLPLAHLRGLRLAAARTDPRRSAAACAARCWSPCRCWSSSSSCPATRLSGPTSWVRACSADRAGHRRPTLGGHRVVALGALAGLVLAGLAVAAAAAARAAPQPHRRDAPRSTPPPASTRARACGLLLPPELAAAEAAHEPLALVCVRLDHFRDLHDFSGQQGSEAVVQTVARRLKRTLGPDDLAFRLSPDTLAFTLRDRDARAHAHGRRRPATKSPAASSTVTARLCRSASPLTRRCAIPAACSTRPWPARQLRRQPSRPLVIAPAGSAALAELPVAVAL